jgi:ATP-dependent RNA helicase RhlB
MIKKLIKKVLGKEKKEESQPARPKAGQATGEKKTSAPESSSRGAKKNSRPSAGRKKAASSASGEAAKSSGGKEDRSRKSASGKSAAGSGSSGARRKTGGERKGREGSGRGSSTRPKTRSHSSGRRKEEPFPDLPPLPAWSPPENTEDFSAYELPQQVREGIEAAGFTKCTEVQSKVLPIALQGKDVAAQSQTGTGKTAAFLITIFTRLIQRGPVDHPGPRALILAPTRELTFQIERDARLLGGSTGLKLGVAFGGVDYDRQRNALLEGVDILVGTPGRLIDYLKQGVWSGRGVEVLVIDEADRMLDMGFIKDLRFILKRLPPFERRLSMLFSATLSWRAMELTYEYMNLPEQITASPGKMTAEKAEEILYHVGRTEKAALLLGLLKKQSWDRTMIFSNMKIEAEKVGRLLQQHGFRAQAITGNLEQKKRLRLMEDFKKGELPILVATDVASRGLHIEGVSHVVNWDLPQDPEDYVHRIGRTARAGASGKAISLADEESVYHLENIEELIGYKIPVDWHTEDDLAKVERGWERRPPGEGRGRGAGGGRGRSSSSSRGKGASGREGSSGRGGSRGGRPGGGRGRGRRS